MRYIFALILTFGVPWFLYWLVSVTLIPFFGVTSHPVLATIAIICIPSGFSIVAGFFLGNGGKLPDN